MRVRPVILILGPNGQVGFELRRALSVFGDVVAPSSRDIDLFDPGAVRRDLQTTRPDLIVNAAAWTDVDGAESAPDDAYQLNATLPATLADYAAASGIPLVHYSTDYVYPGDGEEPRTEEARTGPLSVYGASKLAGDRNVVESGVQYLIFRTSWVYAARGKNFLRTMLRLGQEREHLRIVDDEIGAPTPARLIAQVTARALQPGSGDRAISFAIQSGVYHLAPRGETSWHGFATAIFDQASASGFDLTIPSSGVGTIASAEYPRPAQRPLNSRLDVTRLEGALGIALPDWHSQLELTLKELTSTAD